MFKSRVFASVQAPTPREELAADDDASLSTSPSARVLACFFEGQVRASHVRIEVL